jgi:tetratricopeptide (TPR) repeat protein
MSPTKSPMVKAVRDLLDRGLIHYSQGERAQAVDLWRQALEVAPRDERATDYLASVGASATAPRAGEVYDAVTDEVARPGALERARRAPFTDEMPVHRPGGGSAGESRGSEGAGLADSDSVITDVEILLRGANSAEQAGELEQALGKVEDVLRRDPENFEASELALDLRRRLSDRYRSALVPLNAVPFLKATDASILELSLDPIGGFLISQIDGEITVEELLTILGTFDEFRVLSSLHFFLENGIIELRTGP